MTVIALASQAEAQRLTPVSVATDGTPGNGASSTPVYSKNGLAIAFTSDATNLAAGDVNASPDVFVRDLTAHTTTRVSVATDGTDRPARSGVSTFSQETPYLLGPNIALNSDGSVVAFSSWAAFDADDTALCTPAGVQRNCTDVYVRDRTLNQTTRVSIPTGGGQADGESGDPDISGDGRYVVFTSLATNLVPGDTNGAEDVFLHDRVTHTTTRLSVSSTGQQLSLRSYSGRISEDGQTIVFVSEGAVVSTPDPVACIGGTATCGRAYQIDRSTGTVTRLPLSMAATPNGAQVRSVLMTPDGRFVAMEVQYPPTDPGANNGTAVEVFDRQTGHLDVGPKVGGVRSMFDVRPMAINAGGRFVTLNDRNLLVGGNLATAPRLTYDRLLRSELPKSESNPPEFPIKFTPGFMQFSPNGLQILTETFFGDTPAATDGTLNVFLWDRDLDHDGMPDTWELQYGLDPANPNDGTLDSDNDGVTNAQEFVNGTHPRGLYKRYFAEGAANAFFSTRFGVFNPNTLNHDFTTVLFEFLGSNSERRGLPLPIQGFQWSGITLDDTTFVQPDNDFSTIVESEFPVIVDRTMTWDKTGYGSHAETSIAAPATTWYMAEGSTGGTFDLFYLLQNPGTAPADVTVTYLLPAPAAPVVKQYTIPPQTRKTIHVDEEDPAVQFTDVSAKVTSDQPILVERAMYFSTPAQAFAAGHEGAAVTAPASSWFLAEGATGSFFDLFLLLANAETAPADVKVTYLLASGDPIVKHYAVAAQSRRTINVDFEDQRLIDTPVSMIVESAVPVIAERAMWWPSPNWYEAHLSAGATTTGTKWALGDGLITNTPGKEAETYILIANTGDTAGSATVTIYFHSGHTLAETVALPAHSRVNVQVSRDFPFAAVEGAFGTIVESDGVPIVVERAMYSNANGQIWAAGTAALATKLQ